MAETKFEPTITIKNELRPCLIEAKQGIAPFGRYSNPKKALFHKWFEERRLILTSAKCDVGDGGVVSELFAIVELENGEIRKVDLECIRFLDSPHKEYGF